MEYKELFTALALAQSEMEIAEKSSSNPFYKSKYADFAEVVRATRPHLTKHGLSVMQPIVTFSDKTYLKTMLCHSSGHSISSEIIINPPKNDVQSLGSYITYLKRYTYMSIVGVAVGDEDDDGNKALQVLDTHEASRILELTKDHPQVLQFILNKINIKEIWDLPKSRYQSVLDYVTKETASKNK